MSTPVYNVYFVAGNVDPTPPRPPKAPAKPAVRLALTPHAPPATPVVAPAAIPGTISVPRRPSAVQPQVPVGTDDDKQERRTTSSCSRSRTRRRHRASHHRHHHRDHHSLRSTSRSERGRSVRTALSSFSQALRPPPGQWDIHTGLWDPYVGNIPPRAHVLPPRVPAPPPLRPFSAFPLVEVDPRVQRTHFFTALGVVWRQIRGAGIGSQISPTLSNLAVTLIERPWSSTYQEVLTRPNFHHLAIRYVDSRFVIVQKHHLQAPVFKVFTDLDFYGCPVELELVADNFTSRLLCWCFWKNNHFSRNPPIAFERTEESSSFNSWIFISVLSSTEFVARTISVICTERLRFVRYSQRVVADKYQRR